MLSTTNGENNLISHDRKAKNLCTDVNRNGGDHESKTYHRSKSKYHLDPEYRERVKARSRAYQKKRYATDIVYRQTKKVLARSQSKKKYTENTEKIKDIRKRKYTTDEKFKGDVLKTKKEKYSKSKGKVKEKRKQRYKADEKFKEKAKEKSKQKYMTDAKFKEYVKFASKSKYRADQTHKERVVERLKKKYKSITEKNPAIRQIYAKRKLRLREHKKMKNIGTKNVLSFREKASKGPVYICTCCTRILFETQVQMYKDDSYRRKGKKIAENVRLSISNKVRQKCSRSKLWICKTCHKKLLKGDLPPESTMNSLELDDIPKELNILNNLEQHLVALHIPFMKVVALPKGGQKAVHGPVVCVPSNTRKTTSLPRGEDADLILRVKLKRKLSYKGYYEYQFVNTSNVQAALEYLKRNNRWYSSIELVNTKNNSRDDVATTEVDSETRVKKEVETHQQNSGQNCENQSTAKVDTEVSEYEQEENGVQYDTCLQPADVGQEVLDHYFDDIYNLAPAEGMNPVRLLQEHGNEAKSFPALFPSGRNTYDEKRSLQLSLCRYFNTRLMNADNRFARDTNYIFYSQYLSELKQVIDKTQISLRKSPTSSKENTHKVISKSLKTASDLKLLFQKDDALRFLQPIRGTPSFWQGAQKDLFAMLRQLGIPTWFCSFSAAEFRWNDIINVILKQQKDPRQAENLDWTEKSKVLKSNPVTVARMFDHRFHIFLRQVILSKANPIGCVTDYFYRVEFQQRGSPHMHCLFWVKNAPKLSDDGYDAVFDFIDQYVTCKLPSKADDSELYEIVSSVQQHSKNHSKSCKKKGTMCRFNFPRPPSEKTFIASPIEMEEEYKQNNSTSESVGSPHRISGEERTTLLIEREDANQQKGTTPASVGSLHKKDAEGCTTMSIERGNYQQIYTTSEFVGCSNHKSDERITTMTILREEDNQKDTIPESLSCSHHRSHERHTIIPTFNETEEEQKHAVTEAVVNRKREED